MTLSRDELMLIEGIKNALGDAALGVDAHKKDQNDDRSHTFTFLHEEIEQEYRLATINLEHQDSICSAFSKIHSYRYLDDPKFALPFKKEMLSRGVPLEEQDAALKAVDKIKDKILKEAGEKDAGWHPDLDRIIEISQPAQIEESKSKDLPKDAYDSDRKFFRDPKVRKWLSSYGTVWESINRRIVPDLKALGYNVNSPSTFWEVYDDDAAEYVIRDDMHFIFEGLKAEYQTKK